MLETQFTEIQTQPQGLNSLNNELYRQHEFFMFPYAVNLLIIVDILLCLSF